MVILAYGVEQPTTGDPGNIFFPALEHLCQRMSFHDHDGVNSAPISSTTITGGNVLAPAGSWVFVSTGVYEQNVNLPAGFLYDTSIIECREEVSKEVMYLTVQRVNATTLNIQAINNLQSVRVYLK